MTTQTAWLEIQKELSQTMSRGEYKLFRPLLERLQIMTNAHYDSPDTVRALFDVVKQMQAKTSEGADLQELAKQAASGFIQPQMNVEGDLDQAGRDFFKQVSFNFFNSSISDLKSEDSDPKISIPIVLLVMNDTEAQELEMGVAFQDYTDEVYVEQFNQLQTLLEAKGMAQWRQRYRATPEGWQPFSNSEQNISDLITRVFDRVDGYQKRLVPQFVDIQTLNDDAHRYHLKELREKGCVVIEDIISMRHPAIQRAYRRSLLDAFLNTIIVRIAPTSDALRVMQQMFAFSEQYVDLEFYKRLTVDWDGRCNEVSGDAELGRWLKDQAPKLLPDDEKSKSGWRSHMYK